MGLDDLLENQLDHSPKFQKLHIYSHFYVTGSKLSLFSLYEQQFPRYAPIFKIDIELYLGMKLGKWPKFQKLHIYPLSIPGGRI